MYSPKLFCAEKPATAQLDQDPPVINTWYTILPRTYNCRLIYIAVRRTDDDANAKNLAVRVIIDGQTVTDTTILGNDNTWYYGYLLSEFNSMQFTTTIRNVGYYVDLVGRDVQVDVRQTVAPGANAQLDGRVQYEVKK